MGELTQVEICMHRARPRKEQDALSEQNSTRDVNPKRMPDHHTSNYYTVVILLSCTDESVPSDFLSSALQRVLEMSRHRKGHPNTSTTPAECCPRKTILVLVRTANQRLPGLDSRHRPPGKSATSNTINTMSPASSLGSTIRRHSIDILRTRRVCEKADFNENRQSKKGGLDPTNV